MAREHVGVTVSTDAQAEAVVSGLVRGGMPFEAEPWPDGEWRITVKDEHGGRLREIARLATGGCDHVWEQTAGGVECTICHSSMPGTP